MTDWYYDPENGDDSNDGLSQEKPKKTLPSLNTLPFSGMRVGDRILMPYKGAPLVELHVKFAMDAFGELNDPECLERPVYKFDENGRVIDG